MRKELKKTVLDDLVDKGLDPDLVSETFLAKPKVTDDISQLLKNITNLFKEIPASSPFRTTMQQAVFQGIFYFNLIIFILLIFQMFQLFLLPLFLTANQSQLKTQKEKMLIQFHILFAIMCLLTHLIMKFLKFLKKSVNT